MPGSCCVKLSASESRIDPRPVEIEEDEKDEIDDSLLLRHLHPEVANRPETLPTCPECNEELVAAPGLFFCLACGKNYCVENP